MPGVRQDAADRRFAALSLIAGCNGEIDIIQARKALGKMRNDTRRHARHRAGARHQQHLGCLSSGIQLANITDKAAIVGQVYVVAAHRNTGLRYAVVLPLKWTAGMDQQIRLQRLQLLYQVRRL